MDSSKHEATQPLQKSKKLHYVDNCRSCLTALVILHHTATSYGGLGRNTYQSSFHTQASSTALVGLNMFDQSFFMGTYMYLGGYFSRRALQRKSRESFIKDRLYRLGLPSIAYTAIGAPLCAAVVKAWEGGKVDLPWLVDYWRHQRGLRGPVWFCATLLCFDLALVAVDKFRGLPPKKPQSDEAGQQVQPLNLYASVALCSVTDFFVRTVYPVGKVLNPLKVQPAFLSQYIATYALGASVDEIDTAIPSPAILTGLLLTSIASGTILFQGLKSDPRATAQQMVGGQNWLAAAYALWNNANGYLVGSCVLAAFKKYSNTPWTTINTFAFPAFLVHMPVITILGVATDNWNMGPVAKTYLIGGLGIISSWIVGYAADRVWTLAKKTVVSQRARKA